MRKIIYVFLIILLVIVYKNCMNFEVTTLDLVDGYETRWGVKISEPDRFENIWSAKYPSHGDGEWITRLIYKESIPQNNMNQFSIVTEENIEQVNKYIATFISNTKNAYSSTDKAAVIKVFNQNPIKVEVGDFYYHKSENEGYDTFTALYNRSENNIYTFVWHQ